MLYILYTAVILMLVGCDQLLKSWTVHHLELGQSAAFLPGFMQLTRCTTTVRHGPAFPVKRRCWWW